MKIDSLLIDTELREFGYLALPHQGDSSTKLIHLSLKSLSQTKKQGNVVILDKEGPGDWNCQASQLLAFILRCNGFEVFHSSSFQELIAISRENPVDFIIADPSKYCDHPKNFLPLVDSLWEELFENCFQTTSHVRLIHFSNYHGSIYEANKLKHSRLSGEWSKNLGLSQLIQLVHKDLLKEETQPTAVRSDSQVDLTANLKREVS